MDDKKVISASEINRYIYCNYQWYYERLYGRKHISGLRKLRNQERGYTDSTKSNFVRGNKFHEGYVFRDRLDRVWKVVRIAVVLLVLSVIIYMIWRQII